MNHKRLLTVLLLNRSFVNDDDDDDDSQVLESLEMQAVIPALDNSGHVERVAL